MNEINSVHLVGGLLGVNSNKTDNLVIKNTDITNIDKYKQLVVFLDSPNILRFLGINIQKIKNPQLNEGG
jgi:hypothetical protein